jgi:hypothetical protein
MLFVLFEAAPSDIADLRPTTFDVSRALCGDF